jgi:hypothetical protein
MTDELGWVMDSQNYQNFTIDKNNNESAQHAASVGKTEQSASYCYTEYLTLGWHLWVSGDGTIGGNAMQCVALLCFNTACIS